MSVYKTEKAIYTAEDFLLWSKNGMLELSPKFQRNPVWGPSARSFLIDTILREMTIPPIYMRITQNRGATQAVREVVDGQQRIRAVLDFVSKGGFRLSKTLHSDWKNKTFEELDDKEKTRIMQFSFSAEMFKGISDPQIFEVFCRLNMNGVALNAQELRNARFFGLFKQTCYAMAFDQIEFWRYNKIFTEQGLARMLEVQLTSELLIAGIDGMQDKKNSIGEFYKNFNDEYPEQIRDERRFRETMEAISESFPEGLSETEFSRAPLFYSLYCVVYHRMFGMPGIQRASPKRRLKAEDRTSLKRAILKLSIILLSSKDPAYSPPAKFAAFLTACARQTDNISPRKERFNAICDEAF